MRRSIADPVVALDPGSGPLYQQIYDGYRAAILDGRLRAGNRIPSTRALAEKLGISRLPVLNAFEQLSHEGYLEGRVGSGTYVAASVLEKERAAPRRAKHRAQASTGRTKQHEHRANARSVRVVEAMAVQADCRPFRLSLPGLDHFPHATWSRLVCRHARRMPVELMAYGEPAGYLPLREAIADHLRVTRAVSCDASQILIVSGSQMALQLCARVLLGSGDVFYFEEPGYFGARQALAATGARPQTVPVDDEGLMIGSMAVGKQAARLAYVTPSHQYPLGVAMNAQRRLGLLEWARRHASWIVEDDYDSYYRFASRPLRALQGMDETSRVIYVGTFSKVLFPALRIGYVVAPPVLLDAFCEQRGALDLFPASLYQLALADFLHEGHLARHVRRMRAVYQKRRDVLVEAIRRQLEGILTIVNADAGMHLTAWLPADVDDRQVARRAAVRGINVTALSSCYFGKVSKSGLVLGFGGVPEEAIVPAVATLALAIEDAGLGARCNGRNKVTRRR